MEIMPQIIINNSTSSLTMNIINSLGVIIALIGAWISVKKYFHEKNKEVYEKRLNDVYSPLFGYLVKQEKFRELYVPNFNRKGFPILTSNKTELLDRKKFIESLNKTNFGLARPNLIILINIYELLVNLEETLEENSPEWEKASAEKVKVENELYEEILDGYIETTKRLKLDDNILALYKLKFENHQ
ncbi:hypothetical protein [Heliophilum fasciatum]|uniref:Uncharacterized protein n=1 Tax=Heliophilum fasciatum TaxID=35700 RepID=A0A4R2RI96_9FIRM|nr:hypothetical protein [Heliophilum fasciatum]MCW2278717.1 hypothetical protein [Heliophilum fasciatum]TCP62544.1 hypothetical protein EDD73_12142 [Heliophilum fasciatum]